MWPNKFFKKRKEKKKKILKLAIEWKKLSANHVSAKGLVSRKYKEHSKLKSKKMNSPIRMWEKDHKETFDQRRYADGK